MNILVKKKLAQFFFKNPDLVAGGPSLSSITGNEKEEQCLSFLKLAEGVHTSSKSLIRCTVCGSPENAAELHSSDETRPITPDSRG